PEMLERVIEEVAGEIPSEGSSGAICSPQTGGQTHDEKPRAARTERRDRCVEPLRLAAAPPLPEALEPRTKRAIPSGFAGPLPLSGALSPPSRRHRSLRRRRPAAAPSNAAEIAAYGARAARALLALRARRDHGQSSAAVRRYPERHRLAGAARRRPLAAVSIWLRPR